MGTLVSFSAAAFTSVPLFAPDRSYLGANAVSSASPGSSPVPFRAVLLVLTSEEGEAGSSGRRFPLLLAVLMILGSGLYRDIALGPIGWCLVSSSVNADSSC
ncbi:unnamed protein product [Dibothriocephalus latus]|uniref:Uncharacterized protein n=1 Tax=Dibothriocephalus latus TaxID=60516 RepID=A0A3P7LJA2_DIBLA|nr:unnamed protein product [Dibothriocephalus latus]